VSYHPKYRLTARLSSHIDDIAAMREKTRIPALRKERRVPSRRFPASQTHSFTLGKVLALANGEDFPVVAERSAPKVLDYFARRLAVEKKAGRKRWTHEDIFTLHKVIASGDIVEPGPAGCYRTIVVRAGGFVPPPPRQVSRLMSELLEWWNTKASELPAVLTSAIVHYRISDIHPFPDGNGRVARALALWELYRSGFDSHLASSLNESYRGERRHYYAALGAVRRHREDLTGWLEYSAEGLRTTLERTWMRSEDWRLH
jgi:Fic family protein